MKPLLVALLFSLVGCGGSVQPGTQGSQIPRSGVVFVGDSIFGRLVNFPAFAQTGYANAGVFGQRTDQMLARFPDTLSGKNICNGFIAADGIGAPDSTYTCTDLPMPPKTVVIMIGWNNMFQGANPEYVEEMLPNIFSMVTMAQNQGVKVVICTLYPADDTAHPATTQAPGFFDVWRIPYNAGIRAIPSVTIVDLSATFAGQENYTIDGVHPNDAGNAEMLNAIQQKMQP